MPRPICVHCASPYGRRSREPIPVTWNAEEPMPDYRGNGMVLSTHIVCNQKSVNGGVAKAERLVWDGVSWDRPYGPFCTLRCAHGYALKAYAATLKAPSPRRRR